MWFLSLPPLLALHGILHHTVMMAAAPFYPLFDSQTQNAWVGRATALVVQSVMLPAAAIWSTPANCLHVIGMWVISDTIHMSLYHNDIASWVHHGFAIVSYLAVFFLPLSSVRIMMAGCLLLEFTSPWIHLCWFANKAGYAGTEWFRRLSTFTLCIYFAIRCIAFPLFVVVATPQIMWVSGAVFTLLNWMWMFQLIGYASAVIKKAGGERLE